MFKFLISLQHNVNLRRYGPRFCDVGMKGRGDGTEQNTEWYNLQIQPIRYQASALPGERIAVQCAHFKLQSTIIMFKIRTHVTRTVSNRFDMQRFKDSPKIGNSSRYSIRFFVYLAILEEFSQYCETKNNNMDWCSRYCQALTYTYMEILLNKS